MTSTTRIEQLLLCPLSAINPTTQQAHCLNVPMLNTESIVINVHAPEIPLYGSYTA